jgi:hypothetical protein
MRFLYHENRSTGSIKEARGHTGSLERDGAKIALLKRKHSKIQNFISPCCSCGIVCLPLEFIHLNQPKAFHNS